MSDEPSLLNNKTMHIMAIDFNVKGVVMIALVTGFCPR